MFRELLMMRWEEVVLKKTKREREKKKGVLYE